MATTPLTPIVFNKGLSADWTTLYTVGADKKGIGIDAVVFNNYTGTKQTFSVRIIQVGTPNDLNEIISFKGVRANGNDLAPAMIGQALVTGGIIQAKASAIDSINVNITATIVDS